MCVYGVCMCFKCKYVHVGQRSTSDLVWDQVGLCSLLCMPGWLTRELPGILQSLLTSHRRLAGITKYATTLDFMWVLRFELRTTQLHTASAFCTEPLLSSSRACGCAWMLCYWVWRYHGLLSADKQGFLSTMTVAFLKFAFLKGMKPPWCVLKPLSHACSQCLLQFSPPSIPSPVTLCAFPFIKEWMLTDFCSRDVLILFCSYLFLLLFGV